MPQILPFRAVRPTRDKVSLIAARPYQSYTLAEREARLANNPFSFLHIVNPGYRYHQEISGPERFELVKNRYQEFKEDNIFIQDKKPSFYIYRIINREGKSFTGIIGTASVEDYKNNVIKRHEDTLSVRENTFKDYLKTVGFNAEPVLLTHPDNDVLSEIIQKTTAHRAEYEFTTTYRDTHFLWLLDNKTAIETIKTQFAGMENLYIADGHHRSSSSYLLAEELKKENPQHFGTEPYNYFMTYIIPESDLRIHGFNRMIKDLNNLSKETFLIRLDKMFKIENRGFEYYSPQKKHQFSMYLDGEFYSLQLRKSAYQHTDALSQLDAKILYDTVLNPILGIDDVRENNRIEYAHAKNAMAYVKGKIDDGSYKVGFGMLPVSVDEMKQIAVENLTMPPKTTYIEPKLRSGVSIYEF